MNQVDEALLDISNRVNPDVLDTILWRGSGTKYLNKFSSKFTWQHTRTPRLTLVWPKLIWFSHATPKFAFCSWLVFHDRLSTGDRMRIWNARATSTCVLCSQEEETRDHLFFTCSYSNRVWCATIGTLLGAHHTSTWTRLQSAILKQRDNKVHFYLACYALQATIYHIWRERNGRNHGHRLIQSRLLSKIIDKTIRNNISAITLSMDTRYASAMTIWFASRLPPL